MLSKISNIFSKILFFAELCAKKHIRQKESNKNNCNENQINLIFIHGIFTIRDNAGR